MTLTLLLDLDDTLLETNMQAFIPAYFQALSAHLAARVSPEIMLPALISGMQLMLENEDPSRTLQEVFEADFYPRIGLDRESLIEVIEQFYDQVFPSLGGVTSRREGALELVDWAQAQNYRVAIATDPLFPRKAVFHRLHWAGLDPDRFELISSFETFHFSKSHPAYFAEVLGRLGWPDGPVLMVGNDVDRDLAPAKALGLATFHVDGAAPPDSESGTAGHGRLTDLRPWLESSDRARLDPAFHSKESVLALMVSAPAVMSGLVQPLPASAWVLEPTPDDWALIEVVCHLRDTEREIHHMQVQLMREESEPFIPRADAGAWAKQRRYLTEDGQAALRDFSAARLETLQKLKEMGAPDWDRRARHAIFGPTDFKEVVGFMAEHDRLHIQQAWKTLKAL